MVNWRKAPEVPAAPYTCLVILVDKPPDRSRYSVGEAAIGYFSLDKRWNIPGYTRTNPVYYWTYLCGLLEPRTEVGKLHPKEDEVIQMSIRQTLHCPECEAESNIDFPIPRKHILLHKSECKRHKADLEVAIQDVKIVKKDSLS